MKEVEEIAQIHILKHLDRPNSHHSCIVELHCLQLGCPMRDFYHTFDDRLFYFITYGFHSSWTMLCVNGILCCISPRNVPSRVITIGTAIKC